MSVNLSEHLPLLAESPDGIKKLRGLILELAVRGKLVPQDPSDEPASELLTRITAERARLVAEVKIKKDKPQAAASKDERPFAIPDQWQFVRLGKVLEMINGRAFKPTDWTTQGLPIVRIQNLNNVLAPFNYSDPETVADRHLIHDDDLLISWSGTPGTSFGAFIWNRGPAVLNQHIFRCVQIGDAYWNRFLRLAINSQLGVLIAKAQGGVGLQHVTKGTLEALLLPLPPLAEQHRIVAKVDELMALCDWLEAEQTDAGAAHATLIQTLLGTLTQSRDAAELAANWRRLSQHLDTLFTTEASLDALKQTILQLAVMGKLVPQDPSDEPASELLKRIAAEKARLMAEGKIRKDKPLADIEQDGLYALPANWRWTSLGSLVKLMDAGWSPACHETPSQHDDTWGVLKTTAVQTLKYLEGENKELPANLDPRPECEVSAGDILITRAGPKNRVAISCLVEKTRPRLMISDKIIRFHLADGGMYEKYVALCLNAGATAEFLEKSKSGMAVSQMNISQDKLRLAPVPVCSTREQHRIVAKVDELMALCDSLKADLAESRARQARLATTLIESALQAA